MGFFRQTGTLARKTLLIVVWRQWLATALRALVLPIAFAIFLGYVRTFLAPPSTYGVGTPTPIRNLTDEFVQNVVGARRRIVFINRGFTGGQIEQVINGVANPLIQAGADVRFANATSDLLGLCRSSLRGSSGCYGAVTFISSPTEGRGQQWSYRLTADYSLGIQIFVDRTDNDAQLFGLPLAHAVDTQIALLQGNPLPSGILEFPYTSLSAQRHADSIQNTFMRAVGSWLGVTYFLAMCGISYHLPGFVATEREMGMSQLIDSMVPGTHQIKSQLARFFSTQLAFWVVYIPSWVSIGAIASSLVFLRTSHAVIIFFHLLTGIALSCYAALGASFFHKAQLSGISVLISALVLAIVAQLAPLGSRSAVLALSVLFPSANYTFFLMEVAAWERRLQPAQLMTAAMRGRYHVPGYVFFVIAAAQIIYFPLLAAVVERLRFGTSSKGRKVHLHTGLEQPAIRIDNFSKTYFAGFWRRLLPSRSWKTPVTAVSRLNLTVRHGETMVLLGANGSGKSTTLDTISAIISPSEGTIEIDGSGGIGLCPQKNVMWGDMTVAEHIAMFDRLKANPRPGGKPEVDRLIRACDLAGKSGKKAKALSGGQKRKLQLAMAFAGGSRVCCIDEVSSGLDPLSRRKIWDILIQERGRRTLLFTTHALDEADALADHVAIMSKGHLKVEGSVVELKNAYGGGYRVHVPGRVDPQVGGLDGTGVTFDGVDTVFQVPSSSNAAQLVQRLEDRGLHNHQVHGPTMEDVFLQLAEEGREEMLPTGNSIGGRPSPIVGMLDASALSSDTDLAMQKSGLDLRKGEDVSMLRQTGILFRKRVRVLSRNYIPYICAMVIPLVTAGLVTFFLANFLPLVCTFAANSNNPVVFTLQSVASAIRLPIGPLSEIRTTNLPAGLTRSQYTFVPQDSFSQFRSYITANPNRTLPGGFYLDTPPAGVPTLAYRADGGAYWAPFAQNLLNSYLMGGNINFQLSTFALPFASSTGNSLQLIIYLGLAMSTYPAFFALYPTFERLRNIRTLHYSNGIQAAPLWLAYILFDLVAVLVVSVLTIVILTTITDVWYRPAYLWVVFFLFGISSTLLSYIISLFATSQLAAFAFAAGGQAIFLLIYFIAFLGLVSFSLPALLIRNLNIVQFTLGLITPSGNLLRALLLTLNQAQILCRDQAYASYPGDIQIYGGPIFYLILQILVFFTFLVLYDNGWRPTWFRRQGVKTTSDHEQAVGLAEMEVLEEIIRTEKSHDALQVLHLNKSFGHEVAVEDLTFGVKHGEVFALLGPNGAGKSTTISLIRGDIRPTSTRESNILVEGLSVNQKRTATRRNLGVCPQFDAIDRMTVTEHLQFYARACGVRDVRNNVENVIAAVGLQEFKHRMADQLSGGNKRKLSLGISIIGNPSVLLLDEPSSGMDAVSKRIMWKLLRTVKHGRSLVLTTHSMEEVSALADRAGIMARRMLAVGTTQMLRTNHGTGLYIHLMHKNAPAVSEEEKRLVERWVYQNIPGATPVGGDMSHGQLRFHVIGSGRTPRNQGGELDDKSAALSTVSDGIESAQNPSGDQRAVKSTTSGTNTMTRILNLLESNKASLGIEFYSLSPTTLEDVFLDIVGKHGVKEHDERTE